MKRSCSYFLAGAAVLFVGMSIAMAQTDPAAKESAREAIKNIRQLTREAIEEIERGEFDLAAAMLDSVLSVDSVNADAAYYRAKILSSRQDTSFAIEILEGAVKGSPRSARLKLLLARLYLGQSLQDKAIGLTDDILSIQPHNGEALYLKGLCLMHSGDTLQAVDILESALTSALDRSGK